MQDSKYDWDERMPKIKESLRKMKEVEDNEYKDVIDKALKIFFDECYSWKNQYDAEYDALEGNVINFWTHPETRKSLDKILKTLQSQEQKIREDILNELLDKGHGGGNWRRLIIQLLNNK